MNLRRPRRLLFALLLLLILLLGSADLCAQDDDWFGLVRNPGEIASLSVQFDRAGATKVFLSVPHKLDDQTAIRQALADGQTLVFPTRHQWRHYTKRKPH